MKKETKRNKSYKYIVRFWYKERTWEVIVDNDKDLFDILNHKEYHVFEVDKLYTDRKAIL